MRASDYCLADPHIPGCTMGEWGYDSKVVLVQRNGAHFQVGKGSEPWLQLGCNSIICNGLLRIRLSAVMEMLPKKFSKGWKQAPPRSISKAVSDYERAIAKKKAAKKKAAKKKAAKKKAAKKKAAKRK